MAVYVFIIGFLPPTMNPLTPLRNGVVVGDGGGGAVGGGWSPPPPPNAAFDTLVFVVIDALRADTVFNRSSNFPYIHVLLDSQQAYGVVARASAPTVTLPRIKVSGRRWCSSVPIVRSICACNVHMNTLVTCVTCVGNDDRHGVKFHGRFAQF